MEFVPVKVSNPITFEEAKEGHYRLWDYLAKTGDPFKPESALEVTNGCYACAYALNFSDKEENWCKMCPVFNTTCCKNGALYSKWCDAVTKRGRMKLAAKIRDLPWTDKSGLLTTTK